MNKNDDLEGRVEVWVQSRIGDNAMNPKERAMRLFEEAAELAQAEGITGYQLCDQIYHVYGRRPGVPEQEAGGVAVCLLAWCAAHGVKFDNVALAEIERIEAKPVSEIRGSIVRKRDADLVRFDE